MNLSLGWMLVIFFVCDVLIGGGFMIFGRS